MKSITMTERLHATYPHFKVGWIRLSGMDNATSHGAVDALVLRLPTIVAHAEDALMARTEPMTLFFKRLNASSRYHIRSLIKATSKGREYRRVNPAVDVLYTVELETGLLMSMHDLRRISGDLAIDLSNAGEGIDHLCGERLAVPLTDIVIRDESAIIAAVTLGISRAACVTGASEDVILFVYGCPDDREEYLADAIDLASNRMRDALSASIVDRGTLQ